MTDGKQLEALVAFVEKSLLPQGFEVTTNTRVVNDEGVQIAEFDVEIRGKMGSTEMAWLIECRDRPGSGAAPGSWIEQLVGRRDRFGFNKVTAVSTTGFAAGAAEYAKEAGIELREVRSVTPEEFDWIVGGGDMSLFTHFSELHGILLLTDEADETKRNALGQALAGATNETRFLKSIVTGDGVSAAEAFFGAVERAGNLFDGMDEKSAARKVQLRAEYPIEDHYVVETAAGAIPIPAILFRGELRIVRTAIPLTTTKRYVHSGNETVISQIAATAPMNMHGGQFSLEFHRMGDDGETHVLLRRVGEA